MNKKITSRKKFTNAIKKNDINTVKELVLNKKVKPEAYNNSALSTASKLGYSEIVIFLLKQPNVRQSDHCFYTLSLALKNKHYDIVEILLNDNKAVFSESDFSKRVVGRYILIDSYDQLKGEDKKELDYLFKLFMKNKYFREAIKTKSLNKYQELVAYEIQKKVKDF